MPDRVVQTATGTFEAPDDHFAQLLRDHDGHQRTDIAVMRSLVGPGDLVLDVGAFIGTVAIPLARAVAPGGEVVAFEAMPEHLRLLRANAARNDVALTIAPFLISSTAGPVTARSYDEHSSGSTWFEPAAPGSAGALDLPVTTLDAWYAEHGGGRPVALIKVDVEGMELDVLRGASALLAAHHPALHVEVASFQLSRYGGSLGELDRLLKSHGYRLYVNLAERNGASDVARLARCGSVRLFGPVLGDVVAVHRSRQVPASRVAGYLRFARLWLKRTRS